MNGGDRKEEWYRLKKSKEQYQPHTMCGSYLDPDSSKPTLKRSFLGRSEYLSPEWIMKKM